MSPSHAGPFLKSARSCHWCYLSCSGTMCSTMGVSALPKSKVICQLIAGAFAFCSPPTGFVGHVFIALFSWLPALGSILPVSPLL